MTVSEQEVWGTGQHLVLDLVTKQFAFVSESGSQTGLVLPAYALWDTRKANQLIRAKWDTQWADFPETARNEALVHWDQCTNAALDVRFTATSLENATVEEARDAFLHICRVGVPLAEKDFLAAIQWTGAQ
jgi:hypothetical protein